MTGRWLVPAGMPDDDVRALVAMLPGEVVRSVWVRVALWEVVG